MGTPPWTRGDKSLESLHGWLFPGAFKTCLGEPIEVSQKEEDGAWTQGRAALCTQLCTHTPRSTTHFIYDVHYSTQEDDSHVLVYLKGTLWSRALHSAELGGPAQMQFSFSVEFLARAWSPHCPSLTLPEWVPPYLLHVSYVGFEVWEITSFLFFSFPQVRYNIINIFLLISKLGEMTY